ncbi:hypothetical protein MIFENG_47 [Hafnia phage vB_HpaM_Meifeng]|nr:hypothetical protein MIFENG_47 [Hafnia phage vB_HpaM_Meifeng]
MTKLTTERLEKFVNDIKTDGMCDITDYQVALALRQLLAYEQAADRPVGEIFRCSGNKTLRWWNDVPEGTVLYAAPVLPKQSELMSIGELLHRLEEQTGEKWVEESEQSVIPDEINSTPDYVKALTKEGAYIYGWNACRAEMLKAQPVSEPYKLPQGWIKGQFSYQDLFNAIGAAVVSKHQSIEISVKAFEDSMLAAAPAQESE